MQVAGWRAYGDHAQLGETGIGIQHEAIGEPQTTRRVETFHQRPSAGIGGGEVLYPGICFKHFITLPGTDKTNIGMRIAPFYGIDQNAGNRDIGSQGYAGEDIDLISVGGCRMERSSGPDSRRKVRCRLFDDLCKQTFVDFA